MFFPYSIKTSKCSGSCNNINNPCTKLCVPDVVKKLNVKVFNLVSGTNETKCIEWQETCKCKYRFSSSVCINKQRWNDDKCRCECKEVIDKGVCDKGFIWNPSICECECSIYCDFSEYLTYKNCHAGFKFEPHVCNKCHDVLMAASELKNIAILSPERVDFRRIFWGISRDETVNRRLIKVSYKRILVQIKRIKL